MISAASSTANMVTQGKFQINAEDNVEGKDKFCDVDVSCAVAVVAASFTNKHPTGSHQGTKYCCYGDLFFQHHFC